MVVGEGDWLATWKGRSLRETWVVTWRRDLVKRRAVLSLWLDSCGWWMIINCVLVVVSGGMGITWQRQTAIGRSQLWHMWRRRRGGEMLLGPSAAI